MKNGVRKRLGGMEDLNATTIRFKDRIAQLEVEASPEALERSQLGAMNESQTIPRYAKKSPKKRVVKDYKAYFGMPIPPPERTHTRNKSPINSFNTVNIKSPLNPLNKSVIEPQPPQVMQKTKYE